MKLRLIAEAESELIEAARYYERRQPGLGTAFVKTIWDAFFDHRLEPRAISFRCDKSKRAGYPPVQSYPLSLSDRL